MNDRLTVRLNPDYQDAIERLATLSGFSKSEVVRLAIDTLVGRLPAGALDDVVRPTWTEADRQLLRATQLEVNRIGVNLNQLVRLGHREGFSALVQEVRDPHKPFTQAIPALRGAAADLIAELEAFRKEREQEAKAS